MSNRNILLSFFSALLAALILFFQDLRWNVFYSFFILTLPFMIVTSHLIFQTDSSEKNDEVIARTLFSWLFVLMFFTIVIFVSKYGAVLSRSAISICFISGFLIEIILRFLTKKFFPDSQGSCVVLYLEKEERMINEIEKNYEIKETIRIDAEKNSENLKHCSYEIEKHTPSNIILIIPKENYKLADFYIKGLSWFPGNINLIQESKKISFFRVDGRKYKIGKLEAYHINYSPLSSSFGNQTLKRIGDFFISFFLIIALLPLFMMIYILVVTSSKGPGIYSQDRVGLNGKIFKMYKFRSMKIHDENEYVQTVKNDSRVTKIGKFIRRSSIDELPQLFNVLWGDMSLVGPRPAAIALNSKYRAIVKNFMSRHKVKPGMSGLAQIKGYRGGDDIEDVKKRLSFDLEYLSKWSLYLDLKILVLTPIEVIRNHKVF